MKKKFVEWFNGKVKYIKGWISTYRNRHNIELEELKIKLEKLNIQLAKELGEKIKLEKALLLAADKVTDERAKSAVLRGENLRMKIRSSLGG